VGEGEVPLLFEDAGVEMVALLGEQGRCAVLDNVVSFAGVVVWRSSWMGGVLRSECRWR